MTSSQARPDQMHPPVPGTGREIVHVGPDHQTEAIQRLMATAGSPADRSRARQFIDHAGKHRIALDRLWALVDSSGRFQATVLAVPGAGRLAMFFASQPGGTAEIPAIGSLIDHACGGLFDLGLVLAQTLLDTDDELSKSAYESGGFHYLAVLSYLERPIESRSEPTPEAPTWPNGFQTEPYDAAKRDELIDILGRSYEDTLDCPGLRGFRQTKDILDGHQRAGNFDPTLWTILRRESEAIGVLLLNPSADHRTIELVYLGLASEYRGRGLGDHLLRHGLRMIHGRREQSLTLAVDEKNEPAISLYCRHGFTPLLRRMALIRTLSQHTSESSM